ncbi:hypothetical protein Tco_0344507 [Tanacetum coccineum]
MAFGGNTRDLGSFGEETNEITDLHQIHEERLFSECGDGIAGIKRRHRDPSSDDVIDLVTTSRRGRLKEDLESSTKARCQGLQRDAIASDIFIYIKPILGKSTTDGCQFLGKRLISWQCKKQTIMASSQQTLNKNPVYHSKIKHIEIRHHFIRDAYEKKPIQVLKVHTDDNVVDLLTKAFDGPRFNFLVVNIGMLNL